MARNISVRLNYSHKKSERGIREYRPKSTQLISFIIIIIIIWFVACSTNGGDEECIWDIGWKARRKETNGKTKT
jgi:hypothetical protein